MTTGNLVLNLTNGTLVNLLTTGNKLMLGLGGVTPWSLEALPPTPSKLLTVQPELIGFIPVTFKTAVVAGTSGNFSYKVDDSFYSNAGVSPAGTAKLYVEAQLQHNDLPVAEYRSIGIYRNVIISATTGLSFYTPNQVQSYSLVYVVNLSPVQRQSSLKEIIKLVVSP